MSSRKSKNKSNNNSNSSYLKTDIDYDKLAEAIVNAHKRIIDTERIESDKRRKEEKEQWYNIIGYKEYPANEKWINKKRHELLNIVVGFWHLLFFKKENATSDKMTFVLLQMTTSSLFSILKLALYLAFIALVIIAIIYRNVNVGFYAIFAFIMARTLRIVIFEIDNIRDRQYLISILTAATSFIAMILAIIALLVR